MLGMAGGVRQVEALNPLVRRLVLQLQLQLFLLEVGETEPGGYAGVTDAARRAARQLRRLAVGTLIVRRLAVAEHGADVGEHDARPVVLVGVDEDAQPLETVGVAEDGAWLSPLAGHPHGHAIAVQVVLARELVLDLDLPVGGREGDPRE